MEKNKVIKFLNYYIKSDELFLNSMRNVYGINYFFSVKVCLYLGLALDLKVSDIKMSQLDMVSDFFSNYFLIERGLRKYRSNIFGSWKEMGIVRGKRLFNGLPINGQRTHTNGKTVRKLFKDLKV